MSFPVVLLVTLLSVSTQLLSVDCCQDYWVSFGRHCYRYFGVHVTWREAEDMCTDLGHAHLVSVHSQKEFDFVYQLWKDLRDDEPNARFPYQGMWIGLTDEHHEGTFKYTDGSSMKYNGFAHGEPNGGRSENFAHFWEYPNRLPFWNDAPNNLQFQVMCKQTC